MTTKKPRGMTKMHDRRNNCYPKAREWSGCAWEVNSIYHAKSAAKRSEIKGTDNVHRGPLQSYGDRNNWNGKENILFNWSLTLWQINGHINYQFISRIDNLKFEKFSQTCGFFNFSSTSNGIA